jgi:hypothetical protein
MPLSAEADLLLRDHANWGSLTSEEKHCQVLELLRFVHLNAGDVSQLEMRKKIVFWISQHTMPSSHVEEGCVLAHLSSAELAEEGVKLVASIGTSELCGPSGTAVRALLAVGGVADIFLKTRHVFDALAPSLCRSRAGTPCIEAWLVALELTRFHKPVTVFVLSNFDYFVGLVRDCLRSENFVARRQALRMLNQLLGDPLYGRARLKLAESPALLCAVMTALRDPSHHIQFEAYHCLKVFLAKPNKKPAIRYIFACNNEGLADFLNEYSTGDARSDGQLADERRLLLQRLVAVEPLTHEEEVLLGV